MVISTFWCTLVAVILGCSALYEQSLIGIRIGGTITSPIKELLVEGGTSQLV